MLIFNHVKEKQKFKRIFKLVSGETLQKIRSIPHGFISLYMNQGCTNSAVVPSFVFPEIFLVLHMNISVQNTEEYLFTTTYLRSNQINVDAIQRPRKTNMVDIKSAHRILVRKPEGEDCTLESWTPIQIDLNSLWCEDEYWLLRIQYKAQ